MVRRGLLTRWQAGLLQGGRTQGFFREHYKILEPLGSGGMGQIFRALDAKTGWHVAVKVLPKKSANADSIRRFRREGQAALSVQHPHIVHTFHLGQHGDTIFLAMELVVGSDLSKHIARHGKLAVPETARIGYQVALALEHARLQGIIISVLQQMGAVRLVGPTAALVAAALRPLEPGTVRQEPAAVVSPPGAFVDEPATAVELSASADVAT